jgi:hypothetical protein
LYFIPHLISRVSPSVQARIGVMKYLLTFFFFLFVSSGLAQSNSVVASPDAKADAMADQLVRDWQADKFKPTVLDAKALETVKDPTELLQKQLRALAQQVRFAPVPKDARVSFNLRRVTVEGEARVYTYPVTSDALGDETLTLTLVPDGGSWKADSVQIGTNADLIPEFVKTTWGAWLFAALSALLLWASIAKTPWRALLEQSSQIVKAYKGIYLGTFGLLFGLFAIGTLVGVANPSITKAIGEFLSTVLSANGVAELTQTNVASAAFGITWNNLRSGIFLTSYIPGSFFAAPAYLIGLFQYPFYGLALAPVGTLPLSAWLLHLPTILIELGAYIFIVASSGVMLFRVIKKTPWSFAFLEYTKCLPLAISFLVLAAWYEAFEIIVLIPLVIK